METPLPLFIICFNRLWSLEKVFANLSGAKNLELHFIDNGSDYFETVEWLKAREREGYPVYWKSKVKSVQEMYRSLTSTIQAHLKAHPETSFYGVNDPDVTVGEDPGTKIDQMVRFLERHKELDGLGPMMEYGDIPDYNPDKKTIVKRYARFCNKPQESDELSFIRAPLDTTFGIYRASFVKRGITTNAARIMGPWRAKHWDWYLDHTRPLPVDHLAYLVSKGSNISHWSGKLDLKAPYFVSLGQRCHLAMWFREQNLSLQAFPFDHIISTMDGICEALFTPDFSPGVTSLKIGLPGSSKFKRSVCLSKDFVFPHHNLGDSEVMLTWKKRLNRLKQLIRFVASLIFVRSVLDPDEYAKACELMDHFPKAARLILVIHKEKEEEGLWTTPHPNIFLSNCHGLKDDGPGTPVHPTSFGPILKLLDGSPLVRAPPCFDLFKLESDHYLGGTVRQEVQPLNTTDKL